MPILRTMLTRLMNWFLLVTLAALVSMPLACDKSKNPAASAPVTVVELVTASFTPTGSPTYTTTITSTATSTYTPVTILSTASFTPTGSATPTFTITDTATITPSPTPTFTPVTILVTATVTETFTGTDTPTMTVTGTPTNSPTKTPTGTPTNCSSFGGGGNGSKTLRGATHTECSPFTLSTLAMVKGLRIQMTGDYTGFNINLAIYDDVSGNPGNLVVQATPQGMVVGWNYLPLPDTPLNPGTYWLASKSSGANDGKVCDETQPGTVMYRLSDPWNGGNFLPSFSSDYNSAYYKLSILADYCVEPGMSPPHTSTPTFTFTVTATPTVTSTATDTPTATPTKTPCSVSGTIGTHNPGSNTGTGISTGYYIYSPYVAPASGALRQASLLVQAQGGDKLQLLIYDNAGGQMTNLVSSSAIYTFPAYTGSSPILLTLPLSDYAITVGQTYYVGTYTYPSFLNGIAYVVDSSGSPSPGYWATGTVTNPASFAPSSLFSTYPLALSVEFCQ